MCLYSVYGRHSERSEESPGVWGFLKAVIRPEGLLVVPANRALLGMTALRRKTDERPGRNFGETSRFGR